MIIRLGALTGGSSPIVVGKRITQTLGSIGDSTMFCHSRVSKLQVVNTKLKQTLAFTLGLILYAVLSSTAVAVQYPIIYVKPKED